MMIESSLRERFFQLEIVESISIIDDDIDVMGVNKRPGAVLKRLILSRKILIMPGAYDALSAKIVETAGFKAVQVTGYGIAASLGVSDTGLISFGEVLDRTRIIVNAVKIPVMADGDTGYGGPINVIRTVSEFIRAGCAGVNLEDQVSPKSCGHMKGKQIITAEEMVRKIEAALHAKKDMGAPDFVLNIRTDAISAIGGKAGVKEAIKRGNMYAKAGADLIFVEAPKSVDEIKSVVKGIKAPVSINMLEGGVTPILSAKELERIGVARMSAPLTTVLSASQAMKKALETLKKDGSTINAANQGMLYPFGKFNLLMGLDSRRELEKTFLAPQKPTRK